MAKLMTLPFGGLSLPDFPVDLDSRKDNLNRAIEVTSTGDLSLDKIISKLKSGAEAQVSLGKKPIIILENKVIPIKTTYHEQSLLFRHSKDAKKLELTASLNLKDAQARAQLAKSKDFDMKDPAILALQGKLAEIKEQKNANKTQVVDLPLDPKKAKASLASLKNHRQGMFGGSSTSRSSPAASPAMGSMTPNPIKRDAKTIKAEGIKRAFLHLIAVRPVSQKYMLECLHVSAPDLESLLQKYGKIVLDGKKYNLSDRGYKEVDPWGFAYKDETNRQDVIENAIAAFDRMRIPTTDPIWQKLLKQEERGKGKTLSRLVLSKTGHTAGVKTPRIQVEGSTEDSTERSGLSAPAVSAAVMARSKSQEKASDLIKKLGSSTPKSTKPNKATVTKSSDTDMARTKTPQTADKKKESPQKTDLKKPTKKSTPVKSTSNSTKVKSAEYIEDSDEEIKTDEVAKLASSQPIKKRKAEDDPSPASKKVDNKKVATKPVTKPAAPEVKKPIVEKNISKTKPVADVKKPISEKVVVKSKPVVEDVKKPVIEKAVNKTKSIEPIKRSQDDTAKKVSSTPSAQTQNKKLPSQQPQRKSVPMARQLSGKKSTSPIKPSPLGSSPPTNMSDFEPDRFHKANSTKSSSSSSSGSPLINQRRERLQLEARRPTAAPSPSANSDKTLKRKVNDLENGNHVNGGFSVRDTSSASSSEPPIKRPRTDSSSTSNSDRTSDASSNTSPSITLSLKDIEYARTFKEQWQKYTLALRDLQALSDPPPEKVERLQRLYAKLKAHKAIIYGWEKGQMA